MYALFIGIHLTGAGEALKVMFVITAIALVGLVVFAISAIGHFDAEQPDQHRADRRGGRDRASCRTATSASGPPSRSRIWFFLAVEGVPLAAEETVRPEKNVPRGIIAAMSVLLVTCTSCWS